MTALLLHSFTKSRDRSTHFPHGKKPGWQFPRRIRPFVNGLGAGLLLMGSLGCDRAALEAAAGWEVYHNDRYDYAFLFPEGWVPTLSPTNQDGQAFSPPDQLDVEIRGWATSDLSEAGLNNELEQIEPEIALPNFTTDQGLAGYLEVEVGPEVSTMTLLLSQNELNYYWQGRSPSDQFAEYYQLFDYVARHYQIELVETEFDPYDFP